MTSRIITGKRTAIDIIRAYHEKQARLGEQKDAPRDTNPLIQTDFSLEDKTDHYTMTGVLYQGSLCRVDLAKALLDNGASRTQDQWVQYSQEVERNDAFRVGDFPLYHALFTTLYRNRDTPQYQEAIEQARTFIDKQMKAKWLTTLTRIGYQPSGQDTIIHNYNMPNQSTLQADVTGPDGLVSTLQGETALFKDLLGTEDMQEIQNVYHWLTNVPLYLWRVNAKPPQIDERVARFDADAGRTNLNCNRYPQYSNATLGVRIFSIGNNRQ